jgi:hypothetical protein
MAAIAYFPILVNRMVRALPPARVAVSLRPLWLRASFSPVQ